MKDKRFEITFGYKEDLINYDKDKLYNELLNVIKDIDTKYIIRTHGMSEKLYELFGFKEYEDLKEQLNNKQPLELKPYLKTLTNNIYKSLNDKDSFISRCLYSSWNNRHYDLNIKFKLVIYSILGREDKHIRLEFEIMSYQKGTGSGSGHSFSFNLIDSEKLNNVKADVNSFNIPQSIKEMYLDYLDSVSDEDININLAKEHIIENIIYSINNFIWEHEDEYKQYKSLQKQCVKEELIEFINQNEFLTSISDTLEVDYGLNKASSYDVLINNVGCKEGEYYTNENRVEIKFLGEVIKTISKNSHTVYEIN